MSQLLYSSHKTVSGGKKSPEKHERYHGLHLPTAQMLILYVKGKRRLSKQKIHLWNVTGSKLLSVKLKDVFECHKYH